MITDRNDTREPNSAAGFSSESLEEITLEDLQAIERRAAARRNVIESTTDSGTGRTILAAADDGRVHVATHAAGKTQLNVRVPSDLKNRIIAHARATGSDIGRVVATAVSDYLARAGD